MKLNIPLAAVAFVVFAASAIGQTGDYTLDGGTSTQSGQTYNANAVDESGVYVLDYGQLTLASPTIIKTGDASNITTSSAYGDNAGVLATGGGQVSIFGGSVTTNASAATGLFATGVASTVRMTDGTITTSGVDSYGVDVTYDGTIVLDDVNVTTEQPSCPALSMGFGGGTISVTSGTLLAEGITSPAIYSIGTVSADRATFTSKESAGAVIDTGGAVGLTDCTLTGLLAGVEIEQTAAGTQAATLVVDGGALTAGYGDLIYLQSSIGDLTANITLEGSATVNTSTGYLVHATTDSTANFTANGEHIAGDLVTDDSSTINTTIEDSTSLTGFINTVGYGNDSLSIDQTSTWNVGGASHLTTLTNDGTVSFATDGLTVDVSGNYSQASTGKLVIVLDGTTAGTNYDQLAVAGKAALAGELEINSASGFTPKIGETFNVVTYGSESGTFSTLGSNSGLTYTVQYGAKEAIITITGGSGIATAPTISTQPVSVKVAPGASVTFSVDATGQGTLKYQWYEGGRTLDGATSASYTIDHVTAADVGSYHVVVSNSVGSVTSSSANLKIKTTTTPAPTVTAAVQGDGEINEGGVNGKVLISRTGGTGSELKVFYQMRGTAVNGTDYVGVNGEELPGKIVIPAGSSSILLKIKATKRPKSSTIEKVTLVVVASSTGDYQIGTAFKAKLELIDEK